MTCESRRTPNVVITWQGLPLYAASAISTAIRQGHETIHVVATKPEVPLVGLEETLGIPVRWITRDSRCTFSELGLAVPDVIFTAGWSVPAFMRLATEVRRSGGRAVCMADNSFRGDLRQCIGALVYRAFYLNHFNRVWVPGRSAAKLMRFYGVPTQRIDQGLYTCDTDVFRSIRPLKDRPLAFIFVGQLCARKNVGRLCSAFLKFLTLTGMRSTLDLFGSGPLQDQLPRHPAIRIHGFANPERLAMALNESRCLVLPSVLDHWGVVVHEAASCGTLLIVSDTTGSALDLCGPENSRLIQAKNDDDLVNAFVWAASLSPSTLCAASQMSQELASTYSNARWADRIHHICESLPRNQPRS